MAAADEAAARGHLSQCPECAGRLSAAMREGGVVRDLLGALDNGPAPAPEFAAVLRTAEARRPARPLARWAAGITVVVALAGAAYAFPGSPVPRWLHALAAWGSGRVGPRSQGSPAPTELEPSPVGIGVTPGDRLDIVFTPPNAAAFVVVRLTEGQTVEVRAPRGAAFESREDQLVVHDRGVAAIYEVEVPRSAPRVEIFAGSKRRFFKQGPLVSGGTPGESPGTYRFTLAP